MIVQEDNAENMAAEKSGAMGESEWIWFRIPESVYQNYLLLGRCPLGRGQISVAEHMTVMHKLSG